MRIAITDSGVGGLSVCAALEAQLRAQPVEQDLDVFYLNAALEDDYSYNSMPTRQERLHTFRNFLDAALEQYAPGGLSVAIVTAVHEDNSAAVVLRGGVAATLGGGSFGSKRRARACASASCELVIRFETVSRSARAPLAPPTEARFSHLCACT